MDLNPAVMLGSRGIPISNRATASRLTLKGYRANLDDYGDGLMNNVNAAILGMREGLGNSTKNPLSQSRNPYGKILDNRSFKPGMQGLGDIADGDEVMTPSFMTAPGATAPAGSGGSSGWFNVLGSFVSNLSAGLG